MTIEIVLFFISSILCVIALRIGYISYKNKNIQHATESFLTTIFVYLSFSILIILPYCVDYSIEPPNELASNSIHLLSILICDIIALFSYKVLQKNISKHYKHYVHAFILSLSIICLTDQLWHESIMLFLNFLGLYIGFNFESDYKRIKVKLKKYYKEEFGSISKICLFLIVTFYIGSHLLDIVEQYKIIILLPWIIVSVVCFVFLLILLLSTKTKFVSLRGTIITLSIHNNINNSMYKRKGVILAVVNGNKRKISIDLSEHESIIACDAYCRGKDVIISGTLIRRLGQYSFCNIAEFTSC